MFKALHLAIVVSWNMDLFFVQIFIWVKLHICLRISLQGKIFTISRKKFKPFDHATRTYQSFTSVTLRREHFLVRITDPLLAAWTFFFLWWHFRALQCPTNQQCFATPASFYSYFCGNETGSGGFKWLDGLWLRSWKTIFQQISVYFNWCSMKADHKNEDHEKWSRRKNLLIYFNGFGHPLNIIETYRMSQVKNERLLTIFCVIAMLSNSLIPIDWLNWSTTFVYGIH